MAISLLSRSGSRILFTLTLGVVCVFFLFAKTPYAPDYEELGERPYPVGYFAKLSQHLATQLAQSEYDYQQALLQRQDLIAKFGPTKDRVDSFPTPESGDFYTLWDFFTASYRCPYRLRRVGTPGDGGKWVCGMEVISRKKNCVVYSIGINDESSFEADMLSLAPGCQIYGYDFSVTHFGPEITADTNLSSRAHFHPYALGGVDNSAGDPPVYTLSTLMESNNHTFIDVLKMDIEGAEFETLEALIKSHLEHGEPLPFGQLQLEIHARNSDYARFERFLGWWEQLEEAGLRPFWTEPNLVYINLVPGVKPELAEYSFINTRGDHSLLTGHP